MMLLGFVAPNKPAHASLCQQVRGRVVKIDGDTLIVESKPGVRTVIDLAKMMVEQRQMIMKTWTARDHAKPFDLCLPLASIGNEAS